MIVYFLGTGTSQGIPVIGSKDPVCLSVDPRDKRLRTSIWIQWKALSLLIDCGPDFRQQMLVSGCERIDAILYTHEHADHTAGLDDIRPFCFQRGQMPVYALERVMQSLERRFDYVFATVDRYPGAPAVSPHLIDRNSDLIIGNQTIVPIEILHGDLSILGFRFDDFVYITDAKYIPDSEWEKLKNIDVLVVNALRIRPHPTHHNLEEALRLIERLQPKKAYITHIGYELGFHEKIQQDLPKNVYLAYDNLQLEIPD
ncbi:MBL fold metallo-hydrolase [Flavobacterium sp. JP2137]|uniref:MBL fold metallo-hydrolase n=1 Tax=Flavobacterium sp. JP2137 TaxID=3414510 RepID=UPI003D2FC20D